MLPSTNSKPPLFIVTVDTELDNSWARTKKIELKNLGEIPRFQDLCENYGVVPTYLVTYECATRDEAISVLKPIADSGRCEIGHHLHCWTTPPFEKEDPPGMDAAWLWAYQFELPNSLFREKAECLRAAIRRAYGQLPTAHRAGRWGIDQRSIDWLVENDFVVESSVTPLTSWVTSAGKATGGPSFYSFPHEPYFWYGKSKLGEDRASLMEIPVTVDIPTKLLQKVCASYIQRELPAARTVDRILRRLGGGRTLRPNPHYPDDALPRIVDRIISHGGLVLNLMIHSSELMLDCSPFSRTKDDCEQVWRRLEDVFKLAKQRHTVPTTLTKAAVSLRQRVE